MSVNIIFFHSFTLKDSLEKAKNCIIAKRNTIHIEVLQLLEFTMRMT